MLSHGHVEMKSPPAFRSKYNPNSAGNQDFDMVNPLKADGSNFPCKGYETLMAASGPGAVVATWAAGSTQTIVLSGGAIHSGGSCQFSLSYDHGTSWKVIHSIIGSCPNAVGESAYAVPVPADAPSSTNVLFAWTWYNKVGNREVYGNCAHVSIEGSSSTDAASSALSKLPDIFRANVGNGCTVPEGTDVAFPDPGPSVERNTEGSSPQGSCGTNEAYGSLVPSSTDTDIYASSLSSSYSTLADSTVPDPTTVTDMDIMPAVTEAKHTPGNDWPSWFTEDPSSTQPKACYPVWTPIGTVFLLLYILLF
ncbi:extracellular protein [Ceratocystis lukuohia]|uniref:Extracellular protein n=1 Tax=Ceratocystis lukuohia TaxID=2019550 RepID=A0ABR4MUF1_9PEZI